jgi:beta-glucosidase
MLQLRLVMMNRPWSVFPLLFLLGYFVLTASATNALAADDADVRVMSFNIRYDEPKDKENAWPNRKSLVANMIRFHHADLVGVQEALKRQLDDLSDLVPEYAWIGVGRADGKADGEFSAILYRKDRFNMLQHATFWLSKTPDLPSKDWDAALPRIVTWAKFTDKQTGKDFFHFNTHFDHRGVKAREESARLLLHRIDLIAGQMPVVVTGDFNFNEASHGYEILTGKIVEKPKTALLALRDARYLSQHGHYGPTSTFNEFKGLVPNMKIDYVFVKGNVRVLQHGALSDTWDGRFPSDHLPVLAEIEFESKQEVKPDAANHEVRRRADALLAQMTLEEKLGQMNQLLVLGSQPIGSLDTAIRKGQIGSLLFISDPAVINRLQRLAITESRLKIPLIFGFDVTHGFHTIFPVSIAMAASWDPKMVERAQTVAAREARAAGINWTFAPMVDITRDPRWGRIVEGAGEDPYLGVAMAAAHVRGLQGDRIGSPGHVLACAKHFAGYGAAEGGRDYDAANISDAQLWNVYFPPFKAAVDAGVGCVMSAYMDLNDVPATGNRWLLRDVLRRDWKFSGFVVSDADSVSDLKTHGFARDGHDAAVKALKAGVNMEMSFGASVYLKNLPTAINQNQVSVKEIDDLVRPLLEAKLKLGLFENPYVDQAKVKSTFDNPAHREAARIAAQRSAVLLKNQNNLLPLGKNAYKKIAVIGPLGDSRQNTLGPWSFAMDITETSTILNGLKTKLGTGTQVEFAPGVQINRSVPSIFDMSLKEKHPTAWTEMQAVDEFKRAVDLAKNSDLAVMVLGENQDMSGEQASRSTLDLPGRQLELLQAVAAIGKPVVLVLLNGRPLNITWAAQNVPAILEAWYPGSEGGNAVADLLFGDAVPGGKLPFTWIKNAGQIPLYYSHNLTQKPSEQENRYWHEKGVPIYPFGYGLSYTTFAFSNLKISQPEIKIGNAVEVSVDVKNTGSRAGDEVVQLYIHQRAGSASRPVRELKGFERVTLAPGETKTVRFKLGPDELRYWNAATKDWMQEAEHFDVWVGNDSSASLHSTFRVTQ